MKLDAPLATVRALPPLFVSVSPVPTSPRTEPPTVYVFVLHETATVVTAAPAIVPVFFVRVHVCVGAEGAAAPGSSRRTRRR